VSPDRDLDNERQVPLGQLCVWVIFWSKWDVIIGPPHPSSSLELLGQVDLALKLLSLCLGGDWHISSKDHVDFRHMLITVGDLSAMFSPTGILRCRHCWWRHPFVIQKSFTLFQIMSIDTMDLTPLFYTIGASEGSLLLLIWELFLAVPVTSAVLLISSVSGVEILVLPFFGWPLATTLQKLSLDFGSLYAYIAICEQISHHLGFFMAIYSIVLILLTPSQKTLMISMS
jgi:hypothetical protein